VKIMHGNMWKDSMADLFLFTGNATLNSQLHLVMGRGAALEAKHRFPNCDRTFGSLLLLRAKVDFSKLKGTTLLQINKRIQAAGPYGVLLHPDIALGVFQVKWHYLECALPELIAHSVKDLAALARQYQSRNKTIAMNFPGIGYGRLDEDRVLPLLDRLPDCVEVWKYPKGEE
jgi:hypothetical protein